MRRIVEEKIAPPTSVRRDYPPALELIVMRALEKRPDDRYQSAEEMRNDLEEFLDESGFRTGPRRMAIYLKQLFAPDAPVTDDGVAQARQLAEPRFGAQGHRRRRVGRAELRPAGVVLHARRGRSGHPPALAVVIAGGAASRSPRAG